MATITEDYVSFETAKLLKEKGLYQTSDKYYNKKGRLSTFEPDFLEEEWWPAYTLQMAMKWLREVHNLFIDITVIASTPMGFTNPIYDRNKNEWQNMYSSQGTYEDACEEAIKYCLDNLI